MKSKNNNRLSIILLVGAVLTGGAGWYLTQHYINDQVTDYKTSFDGERQAIPVVVASRDLVVGDVISPQTVQIRQIPRAYVLKDAIKPSGYAAIEGRQIIHDIKRGESVLGVYINSVKIEGLASLLKDGERAITIPVDTLDTLSGFLNPGDLIDVYITLKDGDNDRTVPLVENVRVLATGKDIDDGISEEKNKYSEITIGVKPRDASRVIHGQTVGDFAVLLRKPEDDQSEFDDYITLDNLIEIPQRNQPVMQEPDRWGFELIKGGTRKSGTGS